MTVRSISKRLTMMAFALIFVVCSCEKDDPIQPDGGNKKVVFIHHSCGGQLLADIGNANAGGLGEALSEAGFFVSDICYGWDAPQNTNIGNSTDIGYWYAWFVEETVQNGTARRDNIMNAVYTHFGKDGVYGDYTRGNQPEGDNEVVIIKSCYPNSDILNAIPNQDSSIIANRDCFSGLYTLPNVKWLYLSLLPYMKSHPEKMFVIMTAPPRSSYAANTANGANTRELNDWLVNEWLEGYFNKNIYVYDHFNVLTDTDNHHRVENGAVVHHTESDSGNTLAYPSSDEHPNTTGNQKSATEFTQCFELWYETWVNGL